ncbi:GIY-YIG nuclease family protein, partial [Candidatus Roizmanbacteria bacterium]|nr:GIY-YIG nuclease family protein [Candidatus Roizmanbacteria bacterium]
MKRMISIGVNKKSIKAVPNAYGIYIFRSESNILYIGKSVNLKTRLLSHLENAVLDPKEKAIIDNSSEIQYVVTDSDFKALLLESQLIQKERPKYNLRWQDDKSYLYIKISLAEEYPKVLVSRKENDGKSVYFGPFPSTRTTSLVLKEIRKMIHFCTQKKLSKKACFYSKIGLCDPCPNEIAHLRNETRRKELKKNYRKSIGQVKEVLRGHTDLVLKNLYKELKELSQKGFYEDAISLRNRIISFEQLVHQRLFISDITTSYNQSEKSLKSLLEFLNKHFTLIKSLRRIECYDVSNLAWTNSTASMVVCVDGLMAKSQYRRFKIRNEKASSDFEMLQEVLFRRLKNQWERPDLIIVDGGKP